MLDPHTFKKKNTVFSSPESKAQVSFSDHNLSVVHHRWLRQSKLFTFSSSSPELLGQLQPNIDKKHPLVKDIQVCLNEGAAFF